MKLQSYHFQKPSPRYQSIILRFVQYLTGNLSYSSIQKPQKWFRYIFDHGGAIFHLGDETFHRGDEKSHLGGETFHHGDEKSHREGETSHRRGETSYF